MVDIDHFTDMIEEVVDEIPRPMLDGLNGGVLVMEEKKHHSHGPPGTLILGEYVVRPFLGKHIILYYGSFAAILGGASPDDVRERVRHTIFHELRHHLETRAGVYDLVRQDEETIRDLWQRRSGSQGRPR